MAGPFHHDVGRDASGKSLDNECLAAGVGTDKCPFRVNLIKTDAAFEGGDEYLEF